MNDNIAALPKVDLHCHLDGSLDFEFVKKTLRERGETPDDAVLWQRLRAANDCTSLAEYLERFALPVCCMQTPREMTAAAYTFVGALQQDNIKYIEVRFAPLLHANADMTERQTIEAVLQGLAQAKQDFGIASNLIVCAMRHHTPEQNLQSFRTAREYYGEGVCAVDLAGDEAALPNGGFAALFAEADRLGMCYTIHAGECGSPVSVADALALGAHRLGHGIAMARQPQLQRLCAARGVGVEMCPVSNFQTKAATDRANYPIREFLAAGVPVTVNTDNRTVSNTSVTREFHLLTEEFGFAPEELGQLTKNAIHCAFANDTVKDRLLRLL